jgi:hypothetical protein
MIKISITEKLWDDVRPGSVKKTGLSEAIRDFTKIASKATDTPKAFDDADAAVKTLAAAIAAAEAEVKKHAADDKKGAAAKLKGWKDECAKAGDDLGKQRTQLGLMKASVEADTALKDLDKTVDAEIAHAAQLEKDVASGKLKDTKAATTALQDLRNAMRDGLKATQKDAFADFIRTRKAVLDWGVKPEDVPLPPTAKAIKAKLPALEAAAEKARIAVEGLVASAGSKRTGNVADLAKGLVADYHAIANKLKAYLPTAKKYGTDAHALGDKFKEQIGKGTPHDKLLPILQSLHQKIMVFDTACVTEIARGRVSSGDVQAKRIKIRDGLQGTDRQEFEKIASEEWNLVMVIYRELSEQIAVAHRQVDRVIRLVSESSPQAQAAASTLGKKFEAERKALTSKFLK